MRQLSVFYYGQFSCTEYPCKFCFLATSVLSDRFSKFFIAQKNPKKYPHNSLHLALSNVSPMEDTQIIPILYQPSKTPWLNRLTSGMILIQHHFDQIIPGLEAKKQYKESHERIHNTLKKSWNNLNKVILKVYVFASWYKQALALTTVMKLCPFKLHYFLLF